MGRQKTRAINPEEAKKFDWEDLTSNSLTEGLSSGGESAGEDEQEIVVNVKRQYTHMGEPVGPTEEKEEVIAVKGFAVEPADVHFKLGVTINMGDYNGVRIDVGARVPCYREEMEEAFKFVRKFVTERMDREKKPINSSLEEKYGRKRTKVEHQF